MAIWLKFKLGKSWGHGNGEVVYVRADSVLAVTQSIEFENESIIDLGEGAGPYDVIGKPEDVLRYVMEAPESSPWKSVLYLGKEDERTSSRNQML